MTKLWNWLRRWWQPAPTTGTGFGRKRFDQPPHDPVKYWGSTGVALALLLASAPLAQAADGSWSDVSNLGGANMNQSDRPGGLGFLNPNANVGQWQRANMPTNTVQTGATMNTFGGWASGWGGWFSGPWYSGPWHSYGSSGRSDGGFQAEPGPGGGGGVAW